VQRYGKVPAVVKRNWNVWPGLRIGELHSPPSAIESCGMESLFAHVTVVPTATVSGFAPNPAEPRFLALLGIDTVSDVPAVVAGVDEGVELGEEELLHAAAAIERTAATRIVRNVIRLLYGLIDLRGLAVSETDCRPTM